MSDVKQPFYRITDFGINAEEYDLIKSWFLHSIKKGRACFIISSKKKYKRGIVNSYSCWVFGKEHIVEMGEQNSELLPEGHEVIAVHGCTISSVHNYHDFKSSVLAGNEPVSNYSFIANPNFGESKWANNM